MGIRIVKGLVPQCRASAIMGHIRACPTNPLAEAGLRTLRWWQSGGWWVDGMANALAACEREQGYLMPPSLQWLPQGNLAYFILDVLEQMELKEFYCAYREDGRGAADYHPGMMVVVLLYAYCTGPVAHGALRVSAPRPVVPALGREPVGR